MIKYCKATQYSASYESNGWLIHAPGDADGEEKYISHTDEIVLESMSLEGNFMVLLEHACDQTPEPLPLIGDQYTRGRRLQRQSG